MIDSFRDPLCYPVQEKVTEPVAETVVNTVNKPEVCALANIFNKIQNVYKMSKTRQDLQAVDAKIILGHDFCFCSTCGKGFYSESHQRSARRP